MGFLSILKKYHKATGIDKVVKKVSPAANLASSKKTRKKVMTGGAAKSLLSKEK